MELRNITSADYQAVAKLVCDSTNAWYQAKGNPPIFSGGPESTMLFCEVYESLDPGCCILAFDEASGELMGSCFYHPRSTHVSLGIMNVAPELFGEGVARKLLDFVVNVADRLELPVRLVSSAMNLDSFSLYSKAGFVPIQSYQDMIIAVPEQGIELPKECPIDAAFLAGARDAKLEDVPAMVECEMAVSGINREKDLKYFIQNARGDWHVSVYENTNGLVKGFLVSISHPGSNMIGPGVCYDEKSAIALLMRELDFRKGKTMVFLVPTVARKLVNFGYSIGAKNCEFHFAQVCGNAKTIDGIVIPTFMPETG